MGTVLHHVLDRAANWIDTMNGSFSRYGNPPVYDSAHFPWVAELEACTDQIRAELLHLLQHRNVPNFQDISEDQADLTQDDGWKTWFFYGYGHRAEEACQACPETARALQRIPGLKTAMFSILQPGKRIPPHYGPYNGVLRFHLPLIVPANSALCGIRVDDQVCHWQEGCGLVFDDSFEHEAWNDSEELRVVLFVDFVRPLRWPGSWLNAAIIRLIALTPFVRKSVANFERLTKDPGVQVGA